MATEGTVEGRVTVRGAANGFVQEIVAGPHQLRSDEPVSVGGTDTGATPYDLLLAALGSCTSMTVGMYARRKQWPLMRVTVRLSHARVHARDCAVCDIEEAMLTVIDRDVEFDGPLSDAQRERLLPSRIAVRFTSRLLPESIFGPHCAPQLRTGFQGRTRQHHDLSPLMNLTP